MYSKYCFWFCFWRHDRSPRWIKVKPVFTCSRFSTCNVPEPLYSVKEQKHECKQRETQMGKCLPDSCRKEKMRMTSWCVKAYLSLVLWNRPLPCVTDRWVPIRKWTSCCLISWIGRTSKDTKPIINLNLENRSGVLMDIKKERWRRKRRRGSFSFFY